MVSSRPHASCDLREHSTSRVELRGFTKESRDQYISTVLQPEIAQKFIDIESIEGGDMVDLSHPLSIVNLTHIYSASGLKLPFTPCRITITLLQCHLLRHLWKINGTKQPEALHSLDGLAHSTNDNFYALCKISYEGLVHEKYSFTSDELSEVQCQVAALPSTGPPQIVTLGLLHAVHSLVSTGSSTQYHFLHLSFQELCAAYYVSKLQDPEKTHNKALEKVMVSILESTYEAENIIPFVPVCNYYSALTGLSNLTVARQIQKTYNRFDCYKEGRGIVDRGYTKEVHNDFDSFINNHDAVCMTYYFAMFEKSQSYRYPSFFEFLMESQNPVFVDEVVGEKMKICVSKDTERMQSIVVKMASSLESITCYGFSESIGISLSCEYHLKEFEVCIFHSVDETTIMTFQGVLNVLHGCPNLKNVTIKVKFHEGVADAAALKLAGALQQMPLERFTLDAHDSIKDTRVAALVPAFSRMSTVMQANWRQRS